MGLFASPNRAAVMNSLPPRDRGAGGGMNQTFQNSAQVLSIGIFFTLMIVGLAATLPHALSAGPAGARRRRAPAAHRAAAAAAGLDPVRGVPRLQPDPAPARPARARVAVAPPTRRSLTGRSFFPHLISAPFRTRPARGVRVRDRRLPGRRRRLADARRRATTTPNARRERLRTRRPSASSSGRSRQFPHTRGAACRLSGTDSPRSA